jgi:hypothetical protein
MDVRRLWMDVKRTSMDKHWKRRQATIRADNYNDQQLRRLTTTTVGNTADGDVIDATLQIPHELCNDGGR